MLLLVLQNTDLLLVQAPVTGAHGRQLAELLKVRDLVSEHAQLLNCAVLFHFEQFTLRVLLALPALRQCLPGRGKLRLERLQLSLKLLLTLFSPPNLLREATCLLETARRHRQLLLCLQAGQRLHRGVDLAPQLCRLRLLAGRSCRQLPALLRGLLPALPRLIQRVSMRLHQPLPNHTALDDFGLKPPLPPQILGGLPDLLHLLPVISFLILQRLPLLLQLCFHLGHLLRIHLHLLLRFL
mmetsp:Transcript_1467/g.3421  ORF Transcript_1467/g.3421 Transcript_1467/m.3421 type:complete len:240 (-) Transcript_1467:907-1626(-)